MGHSQLDTRPAGIALASVGCLGQYARREIRSPAFTAVLCSCRLIRAQIDCLVIIAPLRT